MINSSQIRSGRALLGWTRRELAKRAGVGRETVQRAENASKVPPIRTSGLRAIQAALEAGGVIFLTKRPGDFAWGVAFLGDEQASVAHATIGADSGRLGAIEQRPSVRQVRAARALLGWAQSDLAEASGISTPTLKKLESQGGTFGGMPRTAHSVRAALEEAGVIFLSADDDEGEGVRLRKGLHPSETTRRHRSQPKSET